MTLNKSYILPVLTLVLLGLSLSFAVMGSSAKPAVELYEDDKLRGEVICRYNLKQPQLEVLIVKSEAFEHLIRVEIDANSGVQYMHAKRLIAGAKYTYIPDFEDNNLGFYVEKSIGKVFVISWDSGDYREFDRIGSFLRQIASIDYVEPDFLAFTMSQKISEPQ